ERFFADYNVLPIGRSELRAQVAKDADLAARCQARVGWLLPHLSTANVARDLDLLRQAVGDDELNYVGYSYGTYLGATYANLFPLPAGLVFGYAEHVDFTPQQLYHASDWAVGADTLQQLYLATSPSNRSTPDISIPTVSPPRPNTQEALFGSVCSDSRNP